MFSVCYRGLFNDNIMIYIFKCLHVGEFPAGNNQLGTEYLCRQMQSCTKFQTLKLVYFIIFKYNVHLKRHYCISTEQCSQESTTLYVLRTFMSVGWRHKVLVIRLAHVSVLIIIINLYLKISKKP